MNSISKSDDAYKTIGEITKELGLIDKNTGNLQTYTLRYWETQFKQIRPEIGAGKRRYYSKKNFETIKLIPPSSDCISGLFNIFFTPFIVKHFSFNKNFITLII